MAENLPKRDRLARVEVEKRSLVVADVKSS